MAWVDVKRGSGTIASTPRGRRLSNAVAAQVANAMTKWEEHLLYRSDRKADRRETTARISTLAADGRIGRRKSLILRGLFRRGNGISAGDVAAGLPSAIGKAHACSR
jgi:hypothetical protein